VSDALSRQEELITLRLLMLIEDEFDEVERDFLDDVRKTMKQNENTVMNNRFFNERS
jgi:hypothetical protein